MIDIGSGPALLFLHAFPLNSEMWRPQAAAFADRFRIVAPDIRGFGSGASRVDPWSFDDVREDLFGLLDALGIERCTLIGLSMGGYLAFHFLKAHAERVERFVAADTRARSDNDPEKAGRDGMIAALQSRGHAALAERMIPKLLSSTPEAAVLTGVRKLIDQTSANSAIHALTAMRNREDSSQVPGQIQCPALVIVGQQDLVTRVEEARQLAASIAGSRLVEIPRAGHLSSLEAPDAFNAALAAFLG